MLSLVQGFLGLIGESRQVRVTVKESPKEIIREYFNDVIRALDFDVDFIYYLDGYCMLILKVKMLGFNREKGKNPELITNANKSVSK